MIKRSFLQTALAVASLTASAWSIAAAPTPLKFQLDWRFEGPAAFFVHPGAKGYYQELGLEVTVEAASGAGAIQRVASGTHDLGFADLAALMEFHANHPDAPSKPVAVMMICNTTHLEARGVKREDLFVLPHASHGVQLYGNVIIASPQLIAEKPEALRAFLQAFAKGAREVIAEPAAAIASLKARDGRVNTETETRRLQLAIDTAIDTPRARAEGFGQLRLPRLQLMAEQVAKAFGTKHPVPVNAVWNGSFLPSAAALDVFPKK